MKRLFYLGVMLLSLLQLTTQSVNAMRVHAGSVTVTGGLQATVYVSSTWQSFMNQSNVSVKSTDWTTNNPNVITIRTKRSTSCDFYPDPFIANYSNVEIRFTIICTESGVYHEYELYWDVVTNGGGGNLHDGDTFWYSWNGVRMQFKVISASAMTCMVGAGSAESYDIAVSRTLSVESLIIPEVADGYRVTEVATCAFCRCDMIKKIIMPQSITKIGMNAFQGCKALTSITVPDAVTYIDDGAFSKCEKLEEITLGSSLEKLGFQILWDCDKLTSLTSLSPVPPTVSLWGLGVESHATLFVPAGCVERYKKATGWSSFSKIEKIGGGEDDVLVTSITINETSIVFKEGEIRQLAVTISPDNATDKSVTWASSNTSVATVDNYGKVTAVAAGSATITCKANDGSGVYATCSVTVEEDKVNPTSISVSRSSLSMKTSDTYKLTYSYGYPSGTTSSQKVEPSVTWTSSNPSVATVSDGTVTAVSVGTSVVTVTSANGLSASCNVTVIQEPELPKWNVRQVSGGGNHTMFLNSDGSRVSSVVMEKGRAMFYVMALEEVENASFMVQASAVANILVWSGITLKEPPVPKIEMAGMYDRDGDGIGDSLVVRFSSPPEGSDAPDSLRWVFRDSSSSEFDELIQLLINLKKLLYIWAQYI